MSVACYPFSIVKDRTANLFENSATNSGGGKRDRTAGLLVANQALSQLSYTPEAPTRLIRRTAAECGGPR